MVLESIYSEQQTDLALSHMATLPAIKGYQYGHNTYVTQLKFKDVDKFLKSFPTVQRKINPKKVASLKRYIISGVTDPKAMRFIPSLTVTCRGYIFHDDRIHTMAINTHEAKLSINDGQHRNEAIIQALTELEDDYIHSKDKEYSSKLRSYIDELKDMTIPITIFDNLTETEEKQLFHDTNNLGQRPSRNANIRLNQTDVLSRMSRELADENKYLVHYGVEEDKMSIQGSNKNTILLTTVYEMIKELLSDEFAANPNFLNDENYENYKDYINATFDRLFFVLPPDVNVKGKYLIEKSYTLKSIARFINHARNHLDLMLPEDGIFEVIANTDWTMNLDFWGRYNAIAGVNGNIVFGGGMHGGSKSVYVALMDEATNN